MKRRTMVVATLAAAPTAEPTLAQGVKLPSSLTMTAYDTGTSGFNIAVALGKVLKEKHQSDLRVLPAGNNIARLNPLKVGRAQASAMGNGGYFATEGVFEFATWRIEPDEKQTVSYCYLGFERDAPTQHVSA